MKCHRCGNETGQKTFFMTNEPSCESCADLEMKELLKTHQKAKDMTDPLKSAQDEIKQLNEHLHTANSELKRMAYQVNALKIIIDLYKMQCMKIVNRYVPRQEVISDKEVKIAKIESVLIDILMSKIKGMEA